MEDGQLAFSEAVPPLGDLTTAQQLSLLGDPVLVRVPADLWRSWVEDPAIVTRFDAKRYIRPEEECWPWLGAVSSTGHGSFRAASLPGISRRGTVPAHLFAYQLAHGVIPRLGWKGSDDLVVCHRCDEAGCTNPAHLRLGTAAENRAEWALRRRDPGGPLADVRGAAGRTRAIAAAVRAGLTRAEPAHVIAARVRAAKQEGAPLTLWRDTPPDRHPARQLGVRAAQVTASAVAAGVPEGR